MSRIINQYVDPDPVLRDFVDGYWMLENESEDDREVVVLPDGRVDLFIIQSRISPFRILLLGLETNSVAKVLESGCIIFAISFTPYGANALLQIQFSDIMNSHKLLPSGFGSFSALDLSNFEGFCSKANSFLQSLIPAEFDRRITHLFGLIYASKGEIRVHEMAHSMSWNARGINRYFNEQFGLSPKQYSDIIRFKESLGHIKKGELYPERNFADQSHFIKEIKKQSGVSPKKLFLNEKGKFIQLSVTY